MKPTSLLIAALLVAGAAFAQQAPTPPAQSSSPRTDAVKPTVVKGHVLGESFEDFLGKDGLREKFAACPEALKRAEKYSADLAVYKMEILCKDLMKVAQTGGSVLGITIGDSMTEPHFEFLGWKLTTIWLFVYHSYVVTKADLVEKYGQPTDEQSVVLQNAFGTKWTVMSGTWKMADGAEISASDSFKFGNQETHVEFQSKDEVARTSGRQAKTPNPFN